MVAQHVASIETWEIAEPPPAGVSADDCTAVIAALDRRLAVPTAGDVLAMVAELIRAFRPFIPKMPKGDRLDDLQALYLKVLADVPRHYLEDIKDRATRSWRWGMRMPLPAELTGLVRDEIARARSVRGKAEMLHARLAKAAEAKAANDRLYWERRARESGRTVDAVKAENDAIVEDIFVHKFTRAQALARAAARARGEDPNAVCYDGETDAVSGG